MADAYEDFAADHHHTPARFEVSLCRQSSQPGGSYHAAGRRLLCANSEMLSSVLLPPMRFLIAATAKRRSVAARRYT